MRIEILGSEFESGSNIIKIIHLANCNDNPKRFSKDTD